MQDQPNLYDEWIEEASEQKFLSWYQQEVLNSFDTNTIVGE